MSTEDRTATRDEVWFTITAATSGNPLGPKLPPPVSVNLYAKTCGVTLTFDVIENARAWARWLGVEETESVNPTAGVFWCDVSNKRCGWYWSIAVYAHDMRSLTPQDSIVGRDQGSLMAVDGNDRPQSTPEEAMLVTLAALSPDTLDDIAAMTSLTGVVDVPAKLAVPCGRCGHSENVHQANHTADGRLCIDCADFCKPVVLVPAGVEGWAIDGRTK